jgi:hypothetical protein
MLKERGAKLTLAAALSITVTAFAVGWLTHVVLAALRVVL